MSSDQYYVLGNRLTATVDSVRFWLVTEKDLAGQGHGVLINQIGNMVMQTENPWGWGGAKCIFGACR